MKFKVTFEDVIEAETKEQAYDEMVKYCYEIGFNRDVSAFEFEEVTSDTPSPLHSYGEAARALTESVLEDMSIDFLEDGE